MIAKQSIGSSFMGALNYNLKKMNSPDEKDRAELLATNFISLEKGMIKKEVDLVVSLNPALKRNTYHTSLNFASGEKVSNKRMLAITREYMERMGFDNNPYFIFRHHDTSHPHCHILALRTRFDGTTVSDSNNYKRSEKIIRELEKQYDLARVEDSGKSLFRAPDKDELEMVQRTGRASLKMVLQEKVNTALLKSSTLKTFIMHLEQAGVQVLFNQASTGRVSGITYFMEDFKAKGQALGNRYKWANIIKTLDYEQIRDGQEISQANSRTKARYGEGKAGSSADLGLYREKPDNHQAGTEGPEQKPTNPGGRNPKETGDSGHWDNDHGKYFDETGEAAGENEKAVDDHLLHGDRSAPGLHHGFGFKGLDIDIVPEDEYKKRRRRMR